MVGGAGSSPNQNYYHQTRSAVLPPLHTAAIYLRPTHRLNLAYPKLSQTVYGSENFSVSSSSMVTVLR